MFSWHSTIRVEKNLHEKRESFFLKGEQAITLHEIIVCTSYTTILERANIQVDGESPPSFRVYSREVFRARFLRTIPFETNISGLFSFFFCRKILNLARQFLKFKILRKQIHECTSLSISPCKQCISCPFSRKLR